MSCQTSVPERFHGVMVLALFHMPDKREIPIGSAPAENCSVKEFGLPGAVSIGRFVVSRWHVRGGREPMGIQSRNVSLSEVTMCRSGRNAG